MDVRHVCHDAVQGGPEFVAQQQSKNKKRNLVHFFFLPGTLFEEVCVAICM